MRASRSRSKGIEVSGIDAVHATARAADGSPITIRARYLVDASGRDTLLGNKLKIKRKNDKHQSAAIFAHFNGVERDDPARIQATSASTTSSLAGAGSSRCAMA